MDPRNVILALCDEGEPLSSGQFMHRESQLSVCNMLRLLPSSADGLLRMVTEGSSLMEGWNLRAGERLRRSILKSCDPLRKLPERSRSETREREHAGGRAR